MRKLLFPVLIITIFIPIALTLPAWADEIADAFPYLAQHKYYGIHFYYQKSNTRIFAAKESYDPIEIMSTPTRSVRRQVHRGVRSRTQRRPHVLFLSSQG